MPCPPISWVSLQTVMMGGTSVVGDPSRRGRLLMLRLPPMLGSWAQILGLLLLRLKNKGLRAIPMLWICPLQLLLLCQLPLSLWLQHHSLQWTYRFGFAEFSFRKMWILLFYESCGINVLKKSIYFCSLWHLSKQCNQFLCFLFQCRGFKYGCLCRVWK